MRNFFLTGTRLLGLFAALLVLVQSVFATGWPVPYAIQEASPSTQNTEVKQETAAKVSYIEVVTRTTVPSFLFYWMAKTIVIDIPEIDYHNCIALFVNPHSFNVFYIFTSTLAP